LIQFGQGEAGGLDKRVMVTTWKSIGVGIIKAPHMQFTQRQVAAVDGVPLADLPKVQG